MQLGSASAFLPSILLAAGAVALAPSLDAQCLGPDQLDGPPCCAPAVPILPAFPAISLPGLGVCWDACAPSVQTCTKVAIGQPGAISCAQFSAPLDVFDCNGQHLLATKLLLDYTRTWQEMPAPGQQLQVWRFLVKADVGLASTASVACTVPSCLPAHPTAFYYGYLDYAFDCTASTWTGALVLFHGCDRYQHDPLISSRPGIFHPTRSYGLIAPSTAANPFVPAPFVAPSGPAIAEAFRETVNPFTGGCSAEEAITGGFVQLLGQACACPFAFVPPQVSARRLNLVGACASTARTISAFPTLPWLEDMTTSLGTWTTPASYPGPEAVWVDEGTFLHVDGCDPTGVATPYAQIKYGASTQGGYLALSFFGIVLDEFVDLADNYSAALGTPIAPPFVGSVKPTRFLVYANSL